MCIRDRLYIRRGGSARLRFVFGDPFLIKRATVGVADRPIGAALPRGHFATPVSRRAVDLEKMIAGAVFVAMRRGGGRRWHADGGNFCASRAAEPNQCAAMIVAMQQKLDALFGKDTLQSRRVGQAPQITPQRTDRWMMDEYDAERSARLIERFGEPRKLPPAEPARRHERAGRHAGRKRDQRDITAPPHKRKTVETVVAAHIVAPERGGRLLDAAHIDVVIAGYNGDVARRPDRFEPLPRALVFVGQRQVDQIAGDRDVIGAVRLEIAGDGGKNFRPVNVFAFALPVDETKACLLYTSRCV